MKQFLYIITLLISSVYSGTFEMNVDEFITNFHPIKTAQVIKLSEFKINKFILDDKEISKKQAEKYYLDLDYSDYTPPKGSDNKIPMIYMTITAKVHILKDLLNPKNKGETIEITWKDLYTSMCPHYITVMGQNNINGLLVSEETGDYNKIDYSCFDIKCLPELKLALIAQQEVERNKHEIINFYKSLINKTTNHYLLENYYEVLDQYTNDKTVRAFFIQKYKESAKDSEIKDSLEDQLIWIYEDSKYKDELSDLPKEILKKLKDKT